MGMAFVGYVGKGYVRLANSLDSINSVELK